MLSASWRLIASRMSVDQLRQVKRQFEQKQLLVHYNLPRLSLFYMSQQ